MSKSHTEEMIARGEEMQALYERVVKHNKKLHKLLDKLPGMSEDILQLLAYYQGAWMEDRDRLGQHPVRDNLVFAEDPIYDEVQEWDQLLETLEKLSATLLARFREPKQPSNREG